MKTHRRLVAGFACTCTALATAVVSVVLTQPTSRSPIPAQTAAVTFDPSFGAKGLVTQAGSNAATGVAVAPAGVSGAGDIYVSGGDNSHFQVARFTSSGALDHSFGGGIVNAFSGQAAAVTVVPHGLPHAGDAVAVGNSTNSSCGAGIPTPVVAAFLPTGALDPAFGTGGEAIVPCQPAPSLLASNGSLAGVAIDGSGNIDVAGVAFGTAGTAATMVAGFTFSTSTTPQWTDLSLVGVAVNSVPPSTSQANAIAYDPTTKDVVVTGNSQVSGTQYPTVAAFHTITGPGAPPAYKAGDSDSNFAGGVVQPNQAGGNGDGVVVRSDGSVVVSGTEGSAGNLHPFLASFSGTGVPSAGFGTSGQVVNSPGLGQMSQQGGIAYQPAGNLITTANSSGTGSAQEMVLAQYNAFTGALNPSFGSNGVLTERPGAFGSWLAGVAAQSDGKVVATGATPVVHALTGIGLVRVMGPTLSVGNLKTVQTTSNSPVTVHFVASLSEPLDGPVTVTLCGAPAGVVNVAGHGTCANVLVPTGHTSVSVAETIKITTTPGHSQVASLSAHSSPGIAPDPGRGTGKVTVQHLPPPFSFNGYWLVASDGGVFPFHVGFFGSTGNIHLNKPVVGMTATHNGKGYWMVASDGGIFDFGNAKFFGSTGSVHLNRPIVAMAVTPTGKGYWLVASDGGIFNFGDAKFYGSTGSVHLNKPIVGMAATPDGKGYWLVASDGGIFDFGDATFQGSAGNRHLAAPIVGMAAYPGAPGYWLVGADGAVFNYGAAPAEGSLAGRHLNQPIVAMAASNDGGGYWLSATDGGIFQFGDAKYFGSTGGVHLNQPIVGMSG